MRIEKKTWSDMFQKILDGDKTCDLRLDDFECGVGDVLVLREFDLKTAQYASGVLEKEITFCFNTKDLKYWDKKDVEEKGLKVICFK